MWKPLLSIACVCVVSTIGIALPVPIMAPLFLTDLAEHFHKGWLLSFPPMILLGLTLGVYPLGQFFGSPFLGRFADRYGRKTVLQWSCIAGAFGYGASFLALRLESLELFILSRFFTGLWEGNLGIARAVAYDLAAHYRVDKSRIFGYINGATTCGYIFGPIMGGLLSDQSINPSFSHDLPFAVAVLLSIFAWGILELSFTDLHRKKTAETSEEPPKSLRSLILVSFTVTLGFDTLYQFYPIFLVRNWQFNEFDIAIASIFLALSMVITHLFLVSWGRRNFSSKQNIVTFGILISSALIGLILSPYLPLVYALFSAIGLGIGMVGTFLPSFVSDQAPANSQALVMSQLMSARYLGDAFICGLGGVLANHLVEIPLFIAAASVGCGVLVFAGLYPKAS